MFISECSGFQSRPLLSPGAASFTPKASSNQLALSPRALSFEPKSLVGTFSLFEGVEVAKPEPLAEKTSRVFQAARNMEQKMELGKASLREMREHLEAELPISPIMFRYCLTMAYPDDIKHLIITKFAKQEGSLTLEDLLEVLKFPSSHSPSKEVLSRFISYLAVDEIDESQLTKILSYPSFIAEPVLALYLNRNGLISEDLFCSISTSAISEEMFEACLDKFPFGLEASSLVNSLFSYLVDPSRWERVIEKCSPSVFTYDLVFTGLGGKKKAKTKAPTIPFGVKKELLSVFLQSNRTVDRALLYVIIQQGLPEDLLKKAIKSWQRSREGVNQSDCELTLAAALRASRGVYSYDVLKPLLQELKSGYELNCLIELSSSSLDQRLVDAFVMKKVEDEYPTNSSGTLKALSYAFQHRLSFPCIKNLLNRVELNSQEVEKVAFDAAHSQSFPEVLLYLVENYGRTYPQQISSMIENLDKRVNKCPCLSGLVNIFVQSGGELSVDMFYALLKHPEVSSEEMVFFAKKLLANPKVDFSDSELLRKILTHAKYQNAQELILDKFLQVGGQVTISLLETAIFQGGSSKETSLTVVKAMIEEYRRVRNDSSLPFDFLVDLSNYPLEESRWDPVITAIFPSGIGKEDLLQCCQQLHSHAMHAVLDHFFEAGHRHVPYEVVEVCLRRFSSDSFILSRVISACKEWGDLDPILEEKFNFSWLISFPILKQLLTARVKERGAPPQTWLSNALQTSYRYEEIALLLSLGTPVSLDVVLTVLRSKRYHDPDVVALLIDALPRSDREGLEPWINQKEDYSDDDKKWLITLSGKTSVSFL